MKLFKRKLNDKGFSHVELFIVIVVLLVLSGIGYYVYNKNEAHAGNTYTNLGVIQINKDLFFVDQACIASQSGTGSNQTDVVTALMTVDTYAGINNKSGYDPEAYYRINGGPRVKFNNWVEGKYSTIIFNFQPASPNATFWLGVQAIPNSIRGFPGSHQSIGSLTLCNPAIPPTISLSASPSSVKQNGYSTLTWTSTNAASCIASNGWSGNKQISGSIFVGPLAANTTYSLTCYGAGGNSIASTSISVSAVRSHYYTGKLLTISANASDLASVEQLNANSIRAGISLNGSFTNFGNPTYDGTIASFLDTITSAHIVPVMLMNTYNNITATPNIYQEPTTWANAVVNWCKIYCAGGTFYSNNSAANSYYAPHIIEMLNEPYGKWYRGGTVPAQDYANMLIDTRVALNQAGLSDISILGGAGTASYNWWTVDVAAAGGYGAVQGLAVHPYSSDVTTLPAQPVLKDGWDLLYYLHKTYNMNIYVTEVGWCNPNATDSYVCSGNDVTEAGKDTNITDAISQLATVPWIKQFNYFDLKPYQECVTTNSAGKCIQYEYNSYGLYDSNGNKTSAYGTLQTAATANGF